jgi:hypothetical protein
MQAVDLDGEVIAAPKEAFIPACGDRAADAFECLLHAVGVGEVVAAQQQLPARRCAGAPVALQRAPQHEEQRERRRRERDQLQCVQDRRDRVLGRLDRLRFGALLCARRKREVVAELDLSPHVRPVARRDVEPQPGERRHDDERERQQPDLCRCPHHDRPMGM